MLFTFFVFLRSFRFESFLSQFSPFVAHIKNFCGDPGFFLLIMFAKDLTGCFNHCCVDGGDIESKFVSSLFMIVRGANCPLIIAWKVSHTLGSFSFSRSDLSLMCFGSLIHFRVSDEDGRSSSVSCGHFQCQLLENFVFWQCSLLIGSASSQECNQSGCGVVHSGYARSIFWMLCDDQNCSPTQDRYR